MNQEQNHTMEESNPNEKDNTPQNIESIFDKNKKKYKNQAAREKQLRLLRVTLICLGVVILAFLIFRVTTFGARAVARLIGDLEQPTPTATLDLSSLIAASPTPPPTATVLVGGSTYVPELQEVDPEDADPDAPPATRKAGAIFFTPEPTETPTPTNTPLPTAEFGNFDRNNDAPVLEAEIRLRDPRCAAEETEANYILCVVRLAEEPIEP